MLEPKGVLRLRDVPINEPLGPDDVRPRPTGHHASTDSVATFDYASNLRPASVKV